MGINKLMVDNGKEFTYAFVRRQCKPGAAIGRCCRTRVHFSQFPPRLVARIPWQLQEKTMIDFSQTNASRIRPALVLAVAAFAAACSHAQGHGGHGNPPSPPPRAPRIASGLPQRSHSPHQGDRERTRPKPRYTYNSCAVP